MSTAGAGHSTEEDLGLSASTFASFFVFVIGGFVAISLQKSPFPNDEMAKWLVWALPSLQAAFFFYVEAYTEASASIRQKLRDTNLEWWLRVAAQIQLFSLWLYGNDPLVFLLRIAILNFNYLVWDGLTYKRLRASDDNSGIIQSIWASPSQAIFRLDILGFVVTLAAMLIYHAMSTGNTSSISLSIGLGICLTGYIAQVLLGIKSIAYNPFKGFKHTRY